MPKQIFFVPQVPRTAVSKVDYRASAEPGELAQPVTAIALAVPGVTRGTGQRGSTTRTAGPRALRGPSRLPVGKFSRRSRPHRGSARPPLRVPPASLGSGESTLEEAYDFVRSGSGLEEYAEAMDRATC